MCVCVCVYTDDEIDLLGDDVEDDVDVLRAAAGDSEGLDEDEEVCDTHTHTHTHTHTQESHTRSLALSRA